jgi:hypothetical protein
MDNNRPHSDLIETYFQEKFSRLPLQKQLGNLATDLNRVSAYSWESKLSWLNNAQRLLFYTLPNATIEIRTYLEHVNNELQAITEQWEEICSSETRKAALEKQARKWSDETLILAGYEIEVEE